jgi:hypothetical protein
MHRAACGHERELECHVIKSDTIPSCTVTIDHQSPVCGHLASRPCHESVPASPWVPSTAAKTLLAEQRISEAEAPQAHPGQPSPTGCTGQIVLERACGHTQTLACNTALAQLARGDYGLCKLERHEARPDCGHKEKFVCFQYTALLRGEAKLAPCPVEVEAQCQNYKHCGGAVKAVCSNAGPHVCSQKRQWVCEQNHIVEYQVCQQGDLAFCPECLVDQVPTLPPPSLELPPYLASHLAYQKAVQLPIDLQPLETAQQRLIVSMTSWLQKALPLERTQYRPAYLPIFVLSNEPLDNSKPGLFSC